MRRTSTRGSRVLVCVLLAACGRETSARPSLGANGEVDLSAPRAAAGPLDDPLAARADSLVRAGRPWKATALLAAALKAPASASPEVRLAGARAAAGWEGWSEVQRILTGGTWLDRQFGGEGRELLVRSALERNADARLDARLAVEDAADDASRVARRVLLARALDRAGERDSAASHYAAAASRLPRIADWLRLRAAGVTTDSAARATLLRRVVTPVARARIAATDAQARERAGDLAGAARSFRGAGDIGSAFRVEAIGARDEASRAALAARIVKYLESAPQASEVRQAIEVLDRLGPLGGEAELVVARAAASAGISSRAVASFARAAAAAPLSATDQMLQASALARAGRSGDAQRVYASITDDPARAPLAAYSRARLMAQSGGAAAREALRGVIRRYPTAAAASAPALLLLADLQVDDGNLVAADSSLRELIARFPDAAQTPLARFRLGIIRWSTRPALAALTFDSLAMRHPNDEEATAARYWAGRALDRAGKRSEAEERWKAIIGAAPLSYYAMRSAQRLKTEGWTAPAGPDSVARVASVDSAVQRIVALQRLGMDVEARFEIDALAERASRVSGDAPAIAQALRDVGEPARALRIALAAIDRGAPSRALYRIAFPILHEDALVEESRRHGLDPWLVAGLIRQESTWNPRAVSPATARGLMQLMPAVGAEIARSRRYPLWNTALLFEPDVSLELGTAHLASSLRRGVPVEHALAAYNAGASRLARWLDRPGNDDPELFTEWIPYTETRDYVRVVLRNAAVYRAMYGR